jgi:hypothetical protein
MEAYLFDRASCIDRLRPCFVIRWEDQWDPDLWGQTEGENENPSSSIKAETVVVRLTP